MLVAPHFSDAQAVNIGDNKVLRTLLYNRVPPEWVDHAYTFGVVYLQNHFNNPNMLLEQYQVINNACHC